MNKHNWIKAATKNRGKFTAKAKRAGKSVPAFARMKQHSPNATLSKEANLAMTLAGMKKPDAENKAENRAEKGKEE